jgi:AP-1 complex subunit mu
VSATGQVIDSEIKGAIRVRSNLSGMPELKLGLTDRVLFEGHAATQSSGIPSHTHHHSHASSIELEDIRFHQCVRLEKFDAERVITFVPPDGEFHLMTYRISIPQVRHLLHNYCSCDL